MLAGAAKEYSAEMDAKKQRAADILLAQQKYLMESGIAKIKAIRDARKESEARISKGVTLGFDRKAALALEMSGQLDSLITRLDKLNENPKTRVIDTEVKKVSKAILESVPPEKLAKAMEYALDSGAGQEVTADKLINAIFSATTSEELGEAAGMVGDISGESLPSIAPLGLNFSGITNLPESEVKEARSLIESRLAPLIGSEGVMTTSSGESVIKFTNPTAAGLIVDKALQYYLNKRTDPYLSGDLTKVSTEIFNNIKTLVSDEVDIDTIASQYEFNTDPSTFDYTPKEKTFETPSKQKDMSDEEKLFNESRQKIIEQNNLGT